MNEKYLNQNLDEPEYLFYGTTLKIDSLMLENNDQEIITPELVRASAYSFKDTIKKDNLGSQCKITIECNNNYPVMMIENAIINEDMEGYIYVFKNNENFIKNKYSRKYTCNIPQVPCDVLIVKFKDFKDNYEIK